MSSSGFLPVMANTSSAVCLMIVGPRVVALVHPVAEALQATLAVLHRLDERRHVRRSMPISVSMWMTASLAPPWRGP